MKENSKFNEYRFQGKIVVDDIQPWFDFATGSPWDEPEIPWVIDNKVRRQILVLLSKSSMTFEELYTMINFTPKPLIISEDEYHTNVKYQWSKQTLENHLLNLEWYKLIRKSRNKYESMVPILDYENASNIDNYVVKITDKWLSIIKEIKDDISYKIKYNGEPKIHTLTILLEKVIEKLYESLKKENLLPNIPNIKSLWLEQLRKIKFNEWVSKNF
ncbi:MAG: hypothetical protein KGD63_15410 [Candidatus Lokiarchaeota archaeon]|nr:hypothetical protein [Candidatus Lokiarchaeota archaeon]